MAGQEIKPAPLEGVIVTGGPGRGRRYQARTLEFEQGLAHNPNVRGKPLNRPLVTGQVVKG